MKRLVALCVDNINGKVLVFDTLKHDKKWLTFAEITNIEYTYGATIGNLSSTHDALLTASALCSAEYYETWVYKLPWYELDDIAVIGDDIYYGTNMISHKGELHGIVKHNNRYYINKGNSLYCIYKESDLQYAEYKCVNTIEKAQQYTPFGLGNTNGTVVLDLGSHNYVTYYNNITGLHYRNTEAGLWYISETGQKDSYIFMRNSMSTIKRNFLMFLPKYIRDIENIVKANLYQFQQIFIQVDRQTIKHILTFTINYDIIEYNKQLCMRLGVFNIKVNIYNQNGKCKIVVKVMHTPLDMYEQIGEQMTDIDYPRGIELQKIRYVA